MATKIRKKKRCINGTSCGYSCINKMKICRVDLNEQASKALNAAEQKRMATPSLKEPASAALSSEARKIIEAAMGLNKTKENTNNDPFEQLRKAQEKRGKQYKGPKRSLDDFVKNGDGVLGQFGFKEKLERDKEERNRLALEEKVLNAQSGSIGKKIADVQKMSWDDIKKKYKVPNEVKSKDEYIAKLKTDRVKVLDELDLIAERRDALELEAFEDLRNKLLNRKEVNATQYVKDNFWISGNATPGEKNAIGGSIRSLNEDEARRAQEDLKEFAQMMGGRNLQLKNGARIQLVHHDGEDRPYAYDRYVHVGKGAKHHLFHEVAHHLEKTDNEIFEAAEEFRAKRATSSKIEKLDVPGVGDEEVGYKGNYLHPYMGKVYNGQKSTEIISVAMELMATPRGMKRLHEQDPELFSFILGIITADD
jgi:hypothetical protein